jgi:hypothetical protein
MCLPPCLIHKRSFVHTVESCLQFQPPLKCQGDFRYGFPKSQVSEKRTLLDLVARFRETVSVSDRKFSGRPVGVK